MGVHTESRLEIEWVGIQHFGPVEGYADDENAARRRLGRAETCANVSTTGRPMCPEQGVLGVENRLAIVVTVGAMAAPATFC